MQIDCGVVEKEEGKMIVFARCATRCEIEEIMEERKVHQGQTKNLRGGGRKSSSSLVGAATTSE